ncbi:ABC transporter ATP-binding protein [Cecembia lonarensis]|uniref:Spermidine/putrescine import ATP-binding protein PotA n=1 Tax=Cecembia lonarensis (strain CCUG 58316 / KCTC 22772 / LW9) TaxID=1225176 RepID=K1LXC1_CECL9|nr:ABC transporter ATP-binding protein [Cecembia lonarensis]EKB48814.1 Spermidine/putrescine import ATP-binding protein PotA [Cecembia lonarensis LW9]
MTYLKIDKLQKSYDGEIPVLKDFSLQLEKGQVVSVIGESGSGKSTLLKIVAGLESRNTGEVFLNGARISNPKEQLIPGYDEIQLVYQDYHLYPSSSVEENIARPLLLYDKSYKIERLNLILRLLGLEKFRHKLPRQLSGGQQQKVAIGKALSIEPQLLLLDEPFSSLDTIQRRELIAELRVMFQKLGITVLFVTHDLDDALQMSNELVLIQKGKLIQKGHPEQIFSKPKNIYAAKLFSHLNPIPDKKSIFIRPSDVQLFKTSGKPAKVIQKKYLVHFNQLTVQFQNGKTWEVEDKKRIFLPGDRIFLKWERDREIGPIK